MTLDLSNNEDFGNEGTRILVDGIHHNETLREINLDANKIGNDGDI